jgi:hypothetical protein
LQHLIRTYERLDPVKGPLRFRSVGVIDFPTHLRLLQQSELAAAAGKVGGIKPEPDQPASHPFLFDPGS